MIGKDLAGLERERRVHTSDSIEEINDDQEDVSVARFSKKKSEWVRDRNNWPTIY